MSRRQRKTREKRRRHAPAASKRVRTATISGSLVATAVVGAAASDEPASAQGTGFDATLVKDINAMGDSEPKYLANIGGTLFFRAFDGPDDGTTHGTELWRSNGTEAGTQLVKDISPMGNSDLKYLTNFGGAAFFRANDGTYGAELWMTDGTEPGTQLVKDINPGDDDPPVGPDNGYPRQFTDAGGTLFFGATDGNEPASSGNELWMSNGTEAGTQPVEDIHPSGNSFPSYLRNVGGTLLFSADDGTNGRELWRSDGTAMGTYMVKDINTTAGTGSDPYSLTDVGGTLFFAARDASNGVELWRSQAPFNDAELVKDINANAGDGSYPQALTNVGGTLFFAATDGPDNGTTHGTELWRSDGSPGGTQVVKDINASVSSSPINFGSSGGALFFSADDGPDDGTTHGRELWRSDGTDPGTQLVKDINPASGSFPTRLTDANGSLFFAANDGATGQELWRSNGTDAGTQLVEDINPGDDEPPVGPDDSEPKYLTNVGGALFFTATDGAANHGRELWKAFALPAAAPPAVTPISPSNRFSRAGKAKLNKKKGTAKLTFNLPGPGQLQAQQEGTGGGGAAAKGKKRKRGAKIKPVSVTVPRAGAQTITIRPSKAGLASLKRKGKLRVKVRVTFTPTGGRPNSLVVPVPLILK